MLAEMGDVGAPNPRYVGSRIGWPGPLHRRTPCGDSAAGVLRWQRGAGAQGGEGGRGGRSGGRVQAELPGPEAGGTAVPRWPL